MNTGRDWLFAPRVNSRTTSATHSDLATRAKVDALARIEGGNLLSFFSHRVTRKADAADLLGETLLVLWRRADSIPEDDAEGRMWMFGIARKVLATYRRGLSRQIALADRLRGELLVNPQSAAFDSDAVFSPEDIRMAAVLSTLATLSDADREIIMLVHFDGFTLVEAGRLLQLRATTARSRYHRAKNRLKANVEIILDSKENVAQHYRA